MSDSEENFDLDVSGSESDDYAPAPKKTTKAAPKKAAPKAAPKAAAKPKATKKAAKVLVDKDDNADSDGDDPVDEDPASVAGPSAPAPAANGKKKSASETYTKVRAVDASGRVWLLTAGVR